MMTEKFDAFGASMGPDDGERQPDSAEDKALWQLMGLVDDVTPSPDFVDSVRRRIEAEARVTQPWHKSRWIPAAAAAILLAVTIPFAIDGSSSTDQGAPEGNVAEYQGVVDLLDTLSDTDLLALEASEEESVQADWFGG